MAGQENLEGADDRISPATQASTATAVLDASTLPPDAVDPTDPDFVLVAGDPNARARRCTANRSNPDKPGRCEKPAITGANVCTHHGGNLPQVRRAVRRRLVDAKAAKKLADLEVVPIGDPVEELSDLAAEAKAMFELAKANAADQDGKPDEAWMAMVERSLDRCHKMLESCAKLGLEERRQKRYLEQGEQVAAVLRAVLTAVFEALVAAGLDGVVLAKIQRDAVPALVRQHLVETTAEPASLAS